MYNNDHAAAKGDKIKRFGLLIRGIIQDIVMLFSDLFVNLWDNYDLSVVSTLEQTRDSGIKSSSYETLNHKIKSNFN